MQLGDYVTGVDRSYPRSIYRVLGFPIVEGCRDDAVLLEFVSYRGKAFTDKLWVRPLDDFRLASEEEIKIG